MIETFRRMLDILTPAERRNFHALVALLFVVGLFETAGVASILPFMAVLTEPAEGPLLDAATIAAARAAAPGWDVYALEADWRRYWAASGRPRLRSPAKAFLAYCAKRASPD